jgi:hypothetical protein
MADIPSCRERVASFVQDLRAQSVDVSMVKKTVHPFSFRLEERAGIFREGSAIEVENKSGIHFDMGGDRFSILLPSLDSACCDFPVFITRKGGDGSRLVPFGSRTSWGWPTSGELVEVRTGDFNNDCLPDFAFVVKDHAHGFKTYILYMAPIQGALKAFVSTFNDQRLNNGPFDLIWLFVKYLERTGKSLSEGMAFFKTIVSVPKILRLLRHNQSRHFLSFLEHISGNRSLLEAVSVPAIGNRRVDYFSELERILHEVKDPGKAPLLIGLFGKLCTVYDNVFAEKNELALLADVFIKIGHASSKEEIAGLLAAFELTRSYDQEHDTYRFSKEEIEGVLQQIRRLTKMSSSRRLVTALYKLFGGPSEMEPVTFSHLYAKYKDIWKNEYRPLPRDILAADKSIGPEGARALYEKFGITRFGRYHPSMLKHLVRMASDPGYMKDKPLLLVMVAKYDESNMFYWGNRFKHDPRARVIIVETGKYEDFKNKMWWVRDTYGIPDKFITVNHGTIDEIILSEKSRISLRDADKLKGDFADYFGRKKALAILDACDVGAMLEGFAQMWANVFGIETRAARAVEGFLNLFVNGEGNKLRLTPVFFELSWQWFGLNFGGEVFLPQKEGERTLHVYKRAADENVGWQLGGGMSLMGTQVLLDARGGYSRAFLHRLRLRGDAAVHVDPTDGNTSVTFDPEVAFALTNHGMLAVGGSLGEKLTHGREPHLRGWAAFKFLIPAIHGELDIGAATANGWHPAFFLGAQARW